MFLSICPCSLTVSELQFGSFVCSSLKRLSSCSFSEVCHFPIQPSYLGPLEGKMELMMSCLSHWCHLKHQGCVHWLGYYPRVYSTNYRNEGGFSFPIVQLVNVSPLYCTPVFFHLAWLALVADNKSSHFFLSCSLVLDGNPAATNQLRTSNRVCIFNIHVSVGNKVPNRVIFLFFFFTSWRKVWLHPL